MEEFLNAVPITEIDKCGMKKVVSSWCIIGLKMRMPIAMALTKPEDLISCSYLEFHFFRLMSEVKGMNEKNGFTHSKMSSC